MVVQPLNLDSEAALTFDGTDLKLLKDANNADVSLVLGTADAESLTIQVLNGGFNKTAEEIHFSTATASGTADHGKMVFDVDGTDILTVDDGGLEVTGGITLSSVSNAGSDVDKFLVLDGSGNVDFRTGAEVLSDIGAGTGGGDMSNWVLEDGDGTEVTITNAKEVKFVEGGGLDIDWTDTDNGTDADPYDLTFTINAAQTGITSLLATDIKIGEDDETKIDFETADEIHFYANNTEQVYLGDNIFGPQSDSDVDLGSTSVRWKDAYVDSVTSTGAISGSTGTYSGILKTDDTTDATSTTDGSLQTDGGLSVAKDAVIGDDLLMLSDSSVIKFGANSEVTLTHDHDAGLALKHTATADDKPIILTLQTGETDIAANDVLGAIRFQAPDEGTGTDAILVAAGIQAVSEGDFAADANATRLEFLTAASEAAAAKMTLSSAGVLDVDGGITVDNITIDGTEIDLSSGDLTVDVAGDIILDAGGNDFKFSAGGTEVLNITNSSSDVIIKPVVDAKDIIFQQRDGTEVARVEDNGTFNIVTDKLAINATAVTATAAELNLLDGGTSVGGSITLADSDGVVVNDGGTMKTIPASDVKTYAAGSAATKGFAVAMAIAL